MSGPELGIEHATKGRARLRVAGPPPNAAFWEGLERALAGCPLVRAASVRPLTGSVVVEHDGALADVLRWAADRGLFAAPAPPDDAGGLAATAQDPLERVAEAVDAAGERLRRAAGGTLDLRALAFYGLLGAAVLQLARGQVLPAAETLLSHALGLLPRRSGVR